MSVGLPKYRKGWSSSIGFHVNGSMVQYGSVVHAVESTVYSMQKRSEVVTVLDKKFC